MLMKGLESCVNMDCGQPLHLRHLLLAARRDAENSIKSLFQEKINSRFRITNTKRIIVSLQEKVLALLSQ